MELAASKIIRLKITSESTAKAKESKDNVGKCMNNLDESKRVQETGIGIDAHFLPTDLGVLRRRTYDQRAPRSVAISCLHIVRHVGRCCMLKKDGFPGEYL